MVILYELLGLLQSDGSGLNVFAEDMLAPGETGSLPTPTSTRTGGLRVGGSKGIGSIRPLFNLCPAARGGRD
jgi:hypothetical protein